MPAYNEHLIINNQRFTVTVREHKMSSVANNNKWSTNVFEYLKYPAPGHRFILEY